MLDNFEFSDTKQIRKTLLISSFIGISFKMLVKNSTGTIEFFGFKIPVEDASIIPEIVGYLIVFEIGALVIRYSDDFLKDKHQKYLKFINETNNFTQNLTRTQEELIPDKLRPNYRMNNFVSMSVVFLDFIFPILLGLFALATIFLPFLKQVIYNN
jgi:hypothetical protein